MSGTSLDGEIDVALVETDGGAHVKPLEFYAHPYDQDVRDKVRGCFGKTEPDIDTAEAERLVTDIHIEAVKASGFEADIIGFHGQTITHIPPSLKLRRDKSDEGFTWQLGDGAAMAKALGVDVVNDFRSNDMKHGGQGAPLAPLYHQALFSKTIAEAQKPVCVLNMGGVANVTYVGVDTLMAFDCGPANALMDDYMAAHFGKAYDENGAVAERGKADRDVIDAFLDHPYFKAEPPKSLDRNEFEVMLEALPDDKDDAMATLAVMSAVGVMAAVKHFPRNPAVWHVCGGGRRNAFMMNLLEDMLRPAQVMPIEDAGFNGDAIEAECFGYLAVRSLLGLPLSQPSTTGVAEAVSGGVLHKP